MILYRRSSAPPGVYLIVLAVFALYYVSKAVTALRGAKASLRWRSVDGQITWAMMDTRERPWWRRRRRQIGDDGEPNTQYRPDIRYSYRIGNKDYEGRRLYFGAHDWANRRADADIYIARYRPGEKVRVFVDPARPTETVLQRGTDDEAKRYLKWAIVYGVLTLFMTWAAIENGLWSWK